MEGRTTYRDMRFSDGKLSDFGVDGDAIMRIIEDGTAFQTSGCPDCNRPMANETFSKMYNFPRRPEEFEIKEIKRELGIM
jgi:biotin synthase